MLKDYNPEEIEVKWQKFWENNQTFKTTEDFSKPKYYILDMFPYPSGAGLHVGHPEGYTATDIIARYKRMKGFNVLHPMGWDAFGLPAERAAVREGRHPADITKENIANFKQQIKRLGLSYDWSREISTTDPSYYKWTQWIFLKMYEKGLAYLADVPVNWCPAQGTVLANEEVVDGKYAETGEPVERRMMQQWMLRITQYADRLLDDLEDLDWPENVIEMQKQWIGKSMGAEIHFSVPNSTHQFTVYTTRPETIFGVTFCVLAPDHPLIHKIITDKKRQEIEEYIKRFNNLSERELNTLAGRKKTGVSTGAYAMNPLTGLKIPIWVADYVKMDYGTGAVMGVPAHDERDHEFAQIYGLKIQPVLAGIDNTEAGNKDTDILINSDFLNGLSIKEACAKIIDWLEERHHGKRKKVYKLRDWLFSRQRYWGEPFPIAFNEKKEIIPLSGNDLPITLPDLQEFKPTAEGQPPLARATEWLQMTYKGQQCTREVNTMPQWAGSCWYYLRYMDPTNAQAPFSPEKEAYWGQVDLYIGGLEHAVSHLLYSRFWHKVLYDCGIVSTKEPFKKLFNQGMVLGISYKDKQGKYYHSKDIVHKDNKVFTVADGTELTSLVEKMSKSKLNVVNPDDVVAEFGADALRLYEMFMGPLETTKPWQTNSVKGVYNFLQRVWRLSISEEGKLAEIFQNVPEENASDALIKELNITIDKVTHDIEHLKFNTAIAKMMEFINVAKQEKDIPILIWEKFILVLSPFAPHLAEEIWQKLGHTDTLSYYPWPVADAAWLKKNVYEIVICINGKKVNTFQKNTDLSEEEVKNIALNDPKIIAKLKESAVKKTVYIPNKLLNIII